VGGLEAVKMIGGPNVTRLGQLAATGEWSMRREALLADEVRRGPHSFMLDLGSGRSPLLEHLSPEHYIGLDLGAADLAYARTHYSRSGYEFREADFLELDLSPWRGADVVTSSAVFHHLTDEEVVSLLQRLAEEVRPSRMVFSDSVTTGPFRKLFTKLDAGQPDRPREALYDLLRPDFELTETWSYVVPFRTYLYFGFEVSPRA
jgi:cyclopropane fatty-acyl-phospholipid synthase-like methyltransferase